MKNKQTVFVVSALHNGLEYTKSFVKCLVNQDFANLEIILVDDGSTDGTYEFLRKNYSRIKILNGDGNLWWTGSLHLGVTEVVKQAKNGDFLLTVNNDCVFNKDYVSKLVESSNKNDRAIVGSSIIDKKSNKLVETGVEIDWSKGQFKSIKPSGSKKRVVTGMDTLPTKGTLFPIEVFRTIGNFNKSAFPHYLSDYEFVCRAVKSGFCLVVDRRAKLFNFIGRTGIGQEVPPKLSVKEYIELMFSRKSRLNLVDHWRFVTLVCPREYKVFNYMLIFAKAGHYLMSVGPLFLIPKFIKKFKFATQEIL